MQFEAIEGRLDRAILKSQRGASFEEMRHWLIGEVEANQQAQGLACITGTLLLRQGCLLSQLAQPNQLTIHYCFGSGYDVQLLWLSPVRKGMA
ncbi:hypothetical protein [Lampropedia puyangensis]|nr:hypothetical protein [Lampropedia puyangensis]